MMQYQHSLQIDLSLELDRFTLAVDARLPDGIIGLFGASGAGKSSLLESIAGIRRDAVGKIQFDNQPWLDSARGFNLPIEQRDLGYVPQDGLLFPHLTAEGNLRVAHGRRQRRVDSERLEWIVGLLGVEPLRHRAVDNLSGGERQRVALARALASAPRLLLLDEPLAALDIAERRRLLPRLRKLCAELGLPALYISHDPIDMQILCDDLLVLEAGQVIALGDPSAVLLDPRVLPLAVEMGYRNVFGGELVAIDDDTERVRLRPDSADHSQSRARPAVELIVPRSGSVPGDEVTLTLAAAEIIVADHPPSGLSARNILEATVVDIASSARLRWVHCRMRGGPTAVVELTAAACQQLELEAGRPIWLVIKTRSCRVTPTS